MIKLTLTFLITLLGNFSIAQNININGTVNDTNGKPVPFAFIKDVNQHATFTNQNGSFSLVANPASKLIATATNYKETVVKIDDPQNVTITLQEGGSNTPITYSTDAFKESISTEGMTGNKGSQYIATEKGLHGSRYLFDNWVHGYFITSSDDSIKQYNNYRFNYAKIDGTLLYTEDGKTVKQFDGRQIKMFNLFTDEGKTYNFESVPAINTNHFIQILASGSKYKIYKQVLTRFKAADYVSNGMTSTGTTYDEFLDETTYYVVKSGGTPQKFYLKKKSLKEVFAADADKLNKFMSAHNGDIDDQFLQQLGDDLNK